MSKRDIITIGKKHYYAVRNKLGQFMDIVAINKSIREDTQTKSKNIVKPSHGHEGDLKAKMK